VAKDENMIAAKETKARGSSGHFIGTRAIDGARSSSRLGVGQLNPSADWNFPSIPVPSMDSLFAQQKSLFSGEQGIACKASE
jgi:hypothetical protein